MEHASETGFNIYIKPPKNLFVSTILSNDTLNSNSQPRIFTRNTKNGCCIIIFWGYLVMRYFSLDHVEHGETKICIYCNPRIWTCRVHSKSQHQFVRQAGNSCSCKQKLKISIDPYSFSTFGIQTMLIVLCDHTSIRKTGTSNSNFAPHKECPNIIPNYSNIYHT